MWLPFASTSAQGIFSIGRLGGIVQFWAVWVRFVAGANLWKIGQNWAHLGGWELCNGDDSPILCCIGLHFASGLFAAGVGIAKNHPGPRIAWRRIESCW